jgi:hypothetical protein
MDAFVQAQGQYMKAAPGGRRPAAARKGEQGREEGAEGHHALPTARRFKTAAC